MFDLGDVLFGFIRAVFKFLGWAIVEIIFKLYLEPFMYAAGKIALTLLTLGRCALEKPSKFMESMIYLAGGIILVIGLYLIFRLIAYF